MSNKTVQPHKSSIGSLDANLVALLSYLVASLFLIIPGVGYVAWVVPLVVYLMETKSTFVKKNAMQSLVIHALSTLVSLLFRVIIGGILGLIFSGPFSWRSIGIVSLFGTLTTIFAVAVIVFSILAMIRAYQYTEYNIPLIGPIVKWITGLFSGKKGAASAEEAAGTAAGTAENTAYNDAPVSEAQPVVATVEDTVESAVTEATDTVESAVAEVTDTEKTE